MGYAVGWREGGSAGGVVIFRDLSDLGLKRFEMVFTLNFCGFDFA